MAIWVKVEVMSPVTSIRAPNVARNLYEKVSDAGRNGHLQSVLV